MSPILTRPHRPSVISVIAATVIVALLLGLPASGALAADGPATDSADSAPNSDTAAPAASGHQAMRSTPSKPLPFRPDVIPLSQSENWVDPQQSALAAAADDQKPVKTRYLAIYAGSTTGVYFAVASALCDMLRVDFDQHHIRCVALRSQGSGDNRRLMQQGRAQVTIMQSDVTYLASIGADPIPGARSVMSLYGEMGVLVTRAGAGIYQPSDLRGKRLNLGSDGTIGQDLLIEYLSASDLETSDLSRIDTVPIEYSAEGICNDYIDAFAVWTGHPAPLVSDAIESCSIRVLGLSGPGMEALLERHPEYSRLSLPAHLYPGQDVLLETYGVKATLVAYEPVDPEIIYWLVRATVENLPLLRTLNPTLASLELHDMFSVANYLPFHPGAARYWREIGLLDE